MSQKVAIIDYGMGNLRSILNSLKEIGIIGEVITENSSLTSYDKAILPGVGAFSEAMQNLHDRGFTKALGDFVGKGKILLGICLGMQLLCNDSKEDGDFKGLGLIDASVLPFPKKAKLKIPHMGWNSIRITRKDPMILNILSGNDVYFVHSYYVENYVADDVIAVAEYGIEFTCIMRHKNIIGMQFHPEKSQEVGLALLKTVMYL